MNLANKITMSRIILSVIILFVLLFPWHQAGVEIPTDVVDNKIVIDYKYIISGV